MSMTRHSYRVMRIAYPFCASWGLRRTKIPPYKIKSKTSIGGMLLVVRVGDFVRCCSVNN